MNDVQEVGHHLRTDSLSRTPMLDFYDMSPLHAHFAKFEDDVLASVFGCSCEFSLETKTVEDLG
jgi:hypothetical protein